ACLPGHDRISPAAARVLERFVVMKLGATANTEPITYNRAAHGSCRTASRHLDVGFRGVNSTNPIAIPVYGPVRGGAQPVPLIDGSSARAVNYSLASDAHNSRDVNLQAAAGGDGDGGLGARAEAAGHVKAHVAVDHHGVGAAQTDGVGFPVAAADGGAA